MRIALVGAHGTGKTTLSVALAGELGIPVIPEPVRPVLRRHGLESADYRQLSPVLDDRITFCKRAIRAYTV